jgi:hypothetical protein
LMRFGGWGVYAIYLWSRPDRIEALGVLLAAICCHVHWISANEHSGYPAWVEVGTYLSWFVVPILGYRAWRGPQQAKHRGFLLGVWFFLSVGMCAGFCLSTLRAFCQYKLDTRLFSFDESLGPHVNFFVAQFFSHGILRSFIDTVYHSLAFFVALTVGAHLSFASSRFSILKLVCLNSVIGMLLYIVFPASGPIYAFPQFPQIPHGVAMRPIYLDGIPNAMPSLHVGMALLFFFLTRPWKWLRWISGAFLALTVIAIFGTGEHYEVDAIVALPYALFVMAASSSVREGRWVLCATGAVIALWFLVLRFGTFNGWLSWGMVLTTIGTGILMERRLAKTLWCGVVPSMGQNGPAICVPRIAESRVAGNPEPERNTESAGMVARDAWGPGGPVAFRNTRPRPRPISAENAR